jgi:sugar lactone lactonase YvrE
MFAALPDTNASAEGLLGLTVDRVGRVYAAVVSLAGNHGIWRVRYVANTEQGVIARVRINPDGSAGTVEALTPAFAVPVVDGIAVDAHGQIYGVLPAFSVLQTSPLVRIDPDTGAVTAIVAEVVGASAFDKPLSLTFAGGRWGVKAVFVTNGDLPVFPGGPGPGVVKVDTGVPGFPVR